MFAVLVSARFARTFFFVQRNQAEHIDATMPVATDDQLRLLNRNTRQVNFCSQRLDIGHLHPHSRKTYDFFPAQVVHRHVPESGMTGQTKGRRPVPVRDEVKLDVRVQACLCEIEIHLHGYVLEVVGDIDIFQSNGKSCVPRCGKRFCFAGDRHGIAVDNGRKSGFGVVFHVVINIGKKRNADIELAHSVAGAVRHVLKIYAAVDNLNVVERKKERTGVLLF